MQMGRRRKRERRDRKEGGIEFSLKVKRKPSLEKRVWCRSSSWRDQNKIVLPIFFNKILFLIKIRNDLKYLLK